MLISPATAAGIADGRKTRLSHASQARREPPDGADERREIDERLDRWDAARGEPWTREVLRLIAARPGVRAPDLAASLGRATLPFKRDVRRLEALGLAGSLAAGYEISHRGQAYLG